MKHSSDPALSRVVNSNCSLLANRRYSTGPTNEPSSIRSEWGPMRGRPDGLAATADQCVPCLRALMLQLRCRCGTTKGMTPMVPLLHVAAFLRDVGVPVDPEEVFGKAVFGGTAAPRDPSPVGPGQGDRRHPAPSNLSTCPAITCKLCRQKSIVVISRPKRAARGRHSPGWSPATGRRSGGRTRGRSGDKSRTGPG